MQLSRKVTLDVSTHDTLDFRVAHELEQELSAQQLCSDLCLNPKQEGSLAKGDALLQRIKPFKDIIFKKFRKIV